MERPILLSDRTEDNVREVRRRFADSFDLTVRELTVCGRPAAAATLDGMCSDEKIAETVLKPLTSVFAFDTSDFPEEEIEAKVYKGMGLQKSCVFDELCAALVTGSLVLFLENAAFAYIFGVQGYPKKSVEEPEAEQDERSAAEGFTDTLRDNAALLRRRLQTPELILEKLEIGETAHTSVVICYLADRTDRQLLDEARRRLQNAKADTLPGAVSLRPFLDSGPPSLFSATGFTQRPDKLAAKLTEGRIGVLVDGSSFALIVPFLLTDHFQTQDDYASNVFYSFFIRLLRVVSFMISTTLPGLFVAACTFHPEVLPPGIMADIAAAEARTPFSMVTEALLIHLVYEIVREAGLRMPRAVGHAVSIVGALAVGNAAVEAGLIAAPMLLIVAFTAVSSAVVSKLHESVAPIRFALIAVGGLSGFFGIFLGIGLLLTDITTVSFAGIPFSAPFSPFVGRAQRDAFYRSNTKKLGKIRQKIGEMRFG